MARPRRKPVDPVPAVAQPDTVSAFRVTWVEGRMAVNCLLPDHIGSIVYQMWQKRQAGDKLTVVVEEIMVDRSPRR